MTTATSTIKNKQVSKKNIPIFKIFGSGLLAGIITILAIVVRNILTRDYTFELLENLPTW